VRPDGYIGLIAHEGDDAALSRYFGVIRGLREGDETS
jgi:hypothetical protein